MPSFNKVKPFSSSKALLVHPQLYYQDTMKGNYRFRGKGHCFHTFEVQYLTRKTRQILKKKKYIREQWICQASSIQTSIVDNF